jgi:hypothetical protein
MKNKFLTTVVSFFTIMLIFMYLDAPTAATSSEANIPSENNNTLSATQIVVVGEEEEKKEVIPETPKEEEPKKEEPKEVVKEEAPKVEEKKPAAAGSTRSVPSVSQDFKSYTAYTALSRQSSQWKRIQTIAHSDPNGLRKVGDYYCVAMGSYYSTTLGDLFRITTEHGNVFEIIICDFKADRHTNATHQYTARNQCITEFYVDYSCFNSAARRAGSISAISGFSGKITSIEYLGNYFVD